MMPLFNSLTQSFELIEGVYNELVTDNLKIVMYKPRKESTSGRINRRFKSFTDGFKFQVKPCISGLPRKR
ncbi:hypothetical protein JMUB7537_28250 [Staphylococcus aureus]